MYNHFILMKHEMKISVMESQRSEFLYEDFFYFTLNAFHQQHSVLNPVKEVRTQQYTL